MDDIIDHDTFIKKAREIMKVNNFRLWFYKKENNNEIYAMAVSDVGFRGVECQLYKDIRFK